MQDTSDLEAFINRNADDTQFIKNTDEGILLSKLQNSNYKDRLPIAEELRKTYKSIDERNADPKLFEESTSICRESENWASLKSMSDLILLTNEKSSISGKTALVKLKRVESVTLILEKMAFPEKDASAKFAPFENEVYPKLTSL